MNNSFIQLIIDAAESHADKKAMEIVGVEGTKYTFGEMLDQIRSIAFRLEKEGIAFGDRVALIGENHPRWAIAYLGILYRGAVCVPIDPHGEIQTITNFLENSEAKMAFIGEDFIDHFHQVEEKVGRKIPAVILQDQSEVEKGKSGKGKKDEEIGEQQATNENPKSKIQNRTLRSVIGQAHRVPLILIKSHRLQKLKTWRI